jgi:hypothetical protein
MADRAVLDLAALLARDILDDIADSVADEIRRDAMLHRRVTDRLRDEIAMIEHRVLSEIRIEADTAPGDPASLTSTPHKGGGHENE